MTDELRKYVEKCTKEMMAAASCSAEAKAAGQAWLDAAGTGREAAETEKYIAELEADVTPIDGLIAFAGSKAGASVFGDQAAAVAGQARKLKAQGAKYCNCPACTAGAKILEKKAELIRA